MLYDRPEYMKPIKTKTTEARECYRVGHDPATNCVTLTLLADYGSTTLSLSDDEVDRLIRLLRAAKSTQEEE